jgi:Ca2+-binding EF-hand superfamily protein
MERAQGGDLRTRLDENGKFSEEQARKAVRQILLALNYLHKKGIAHRDVKLESIFFDAKDDEHLKLSGLACSKKCGPERSSTTQGDMWNLGVLVFTLLSNDMPKDSAQLAAIREGRFNLTPELLAEVSAEGKDFMTSLLQASPCKRLTAQQALGHPWISQNQSKPDVSREVVQAMQRFSRASLFQRQCMQLLAWSLSSKDVATARDIFASLDIEQQGTISLDVFKYAIMNRVPFVDGKEVCQIFQDLDYNDDGQIHYTDFLASMVGSQIHLTEDKIASTFQRLVDKSGCITPSSLEAVLGSSGSMEAAQAKTGRIDAMAFSAFLGAADTFDETTTVGSLSRNTSLSSDEPMESSNLIAI